MADLFRARHDLPNFDGHDALLSGTARATRTEAGSSVSVSPCSVRAASMIEPARAVVACARQSRRERRLALRWRKLPDRHGHQSVAEVAIRIEVRRRAALDRGILAVDSIGDECRRRIGRSTVRRKHRHGIGYAEREGAPARTRCGDAADAVAVPDADRAASPRDASRRKVAGNADVKALARRAKDRDVAAVVDVSAVERRCAQHRREQLVRDRTCHRRHRRDEDLPEWLAGFRHAPADGAPRLGRARRCAQRRQLGAEFRKDARKPFDSRRMGNPHCLLLSERLQHDIDRPMRKVQAAAHKLLHAWCSHPPLRGRVREGGRMKRMTN